MSADQTNDSYAARRDNIRDTVKWLIAALAALAAAIVGSTPFSHVGSLRGYLLFVALTGVAIGFGCILGALNLSIKLLVTPLFFLSDIENYPELSKVIDDHGKDVLPPGFSSVRQFLKNRLDTQNRLFELLSAKPVSAEEEQLKNARKAEIERLTSSLNATIAISNRLLGLAHFEHLRRGFERARKRLFILSIVGAVSLMLFAWLTTGAELNSVPLHVILDR